MSEDIGICLEIALYPQNVMPLLIRSYCSPTCQRSSYVGFHLGLHCYCFSFHMLKVKVLLVHHLSTTSIYHKRFHIWRLIRRRYQG